MSFDYVTVISRFSPFDNAHMAMVKQALARARSVCLVFIAADLSRSNRYPWSVEERENMAKESLTAELGADFQRLRFLRVFDHLYRDDLWRDKIVTDVAAVISANGDDPATTAVGLLADPKEIGVRRLRSLQPWTEIAPATCPNDITLTAAFLNGLPHWRDQVPAAVAGIMQAFSATPVFTDMADEQVAVEKYVKAWSVAPYPPILVVVDTVLLHSGHILLVERGVTPGKNQWALPGGFVEPHEYLIDAALREVREETGFSEDDQTMLSWLMARFSFEFPTRSARGRAISTGFFFSLPGTKLPAVTGSDDARHAQWMPLSRLPEIRTEIFEDHASMIEYFLGAY